MTEQFFDVESFLGVERSDSLGLPRTVKLVRAIARNPDFELIQGYRSPIDKDLTHEVLVVDVLCDGVPTRNVSGIGYRERIAVGIPAERGALLEVFALRRGFPVTMHQNHSTFDGPLSLCLYFEPPQSVARDWTAPRFLERIQWWLESTARGTIHPADQPPEQLFFSSKFELVLPSNIAELLEATDHHLYPIAICRQPAGGWTVRLRKERAAENASLPVRILHVEAPPIVHGVVERIPTTLGQLAEILAGREFDLRAALVERLQSTISSQGLHQSKQSQMTALLLTVPIIRAKGAKAERRTVVAFVTDVPDGQLGVDVGAFLQSGETFYRDVLPHPVPQTWERHKLDAMQVLFENSGQDAQRQNGVEGDAPTGVLIGAGSLGSALAALWSRMGWGTWTVVDPDHVKPHNVSRHIASDDQVGMHKADVSVQYDSAIVVEGSRMRAITSAAGSGANMDVESAVASASLVVDASTTLEVPRFASIGETQARHMSVFLTPDGRSAVLLAEDRPRKSRLLSLEAQYYRAIISEAWGSHHLAGDVQRFWSGAGCRDISVVMPYAKIWAHAGTLVEQIRSAWLADAAIGRVWQRDDLTGRVEAFELQTAPARSVIAGDLRIIIDEALELKMRRMREAALPNETGGVLLGFIDFNIMALVLVDARPEPSDSVGTPTSFVRGVVGVLEDVVEAGRRTRGIVGYAGEWHSHPEGYSSRPSGLDVLQLAHLAVGMSDDGLPALQAIVGAQDVNLLLGETLPALGEAMPSGS